jgi:hypothetical protein
MNSQWLFNVMHLIGGGFDSLASWSVILHGWDAFMT